MTTRCRHSLETRGFSLLLSRLGRKKENFVLCVCVCVCVWRDGGGGWGAYFDRNKYLEGEAEILNNKTLNVCLTLKIKKQETVLQQCRYLHCVLMYLDSLVKKG